MTIRLALIIDKAPAYVEFQKSRILASWTSAGEDTKIIGALSEAGGASLFGDSMLSLVSLDNGEAIKASVATLEQAINSGTVADLVGSGIIITSREARTGTRKLEALVKQVGGQLIIAAADRKANISTSEKILQELNLNPAARDFLLAYVGDDYESLVPLVRTISALAPEQQKAIREEDLMVRMPQAKGSVPPWNLEKPLFAGNITEVIDIFRRVSDSSSLLVILAVLRNKFTAAYKVSALLEANPRLGDKELAEASGANVKGLFFVKQYHKRYGLKKLETAVSIIAATEDNVKGKSGADPMGLMELMLIRIGQLLKS